MDGTHIQLIKPVTAFNRKITEITLKEPSGALFSRLGQPRIAVVNQSAGSGYWVEQLEVISAYLDALIDMDVAEKPVVLQQLSLADSLRLREALFGFFAEAESKAAATRPAPSHSASNS